MSYQPFDLPEELFDSLFRQGCNESILKYDSYILVEPTTGFARFSIYKKILHHFYSSKSESKSTTNKTCFVYLDFDAAHRKADANCLTEQKISNFLESPVFSINSFFRSDEVYQVLQSATKTARHLQDPDENQSKNFRTIQCNGVKIGLYIASDLYRHDFKYCIAGKEPSTEIIFNKLVQYLFCAFLLRKLSLLLGTRIRCMLSTHDIYFWGFITDFLASECSITSLTYLGGFKPTIKSNLIHRQRSTLKAHRLNPSSYLFYNSNLKITPVHEKNVMDTLLQKVMTAPSSYYDIHTLSHLSTQLEEYSAHNKCCKRLSSQNVIDCLSPNNTLLLCLHSFNDANFDWGYSGFDTIWSFFASVIQNALLIDPNVNIVLRPHPDIFKDWGNYDSIIFDKELNYLFLSQLGSSVANLFVAGPDVSMGTLLKMKQLIPVTHHSYNVVLESLLLGNRVITGMSNPILLHKGFKCLDIITPNAPIYLTIADSFELKSRGIVPMIKTHDLVQFCLNELFDPLQEYSVLDSVWQRKWKSNLADRLPHISFKIDQYNANNSIKLSKYLTLENLIDFSFSFSNKQKLLHESNMLIQEFLKKATAS